MCISPVSAIKGTNTTKIKKGEKVKLLSIDDEGFMTFKLQYGQEVETFCSDFYKRFKIST